MRAWLVRVWREHRLTLVVLAGLLVGYLSLRTSPSDIASAEAFTQAISSGRPTVVNYYSNT